MGCHSPGRVAPYGCTPGSCVWTHRWIRELLCSPGPGQAPNTGCGPSLSGTLPSHSFILYLLFKPSFWDHCCTTGIIKGFLYTGHMQLVNLMAEIQSRRNVYAHTVFFALGPREYPGFWIFYLQLLQEFFRAEEYSFVVCFFLSLLSFVLVLAICFDFVLENFMNGCKINLLFFKHHPFYHP